jgi:hypothetical protein
MSKDRSKQAPHLISCADERLKHDYAGGQGRLTGSTLTAKSTAILKDIGGRQRTPVDPSC